VSEDNLMTLLVVFVVMMVLMTWILDDRRPGRDDPVAIRDAGISFPWIRCVGKVRKDGMNESPVSHDRNPLEGHFADHLTESLETMKVSRDLPPFWIKRSVLCGDVFKQSTWIKMKRVMKRTEREYGDSEDLWICQ